MSRSPTTITFGATEQFSSCAGKEKFDRATANQVVRETKKVALTAYRCRCCEYWHVGRDIPRKHKRKVRLVREKLK